MGKWFWRFVMLCMVASIGFLAWAVVYTSTHYRIAYYTYHDTLTFNTPEEYGNFMLQLDQSRIPTDVVDLKNAEPPIQAHVYFNTRGARPIDAFDYIYHKPFMDAQGWCVGLTLFSMLLSFILFMFVLYHREQDIKAQKAMRLTAITAMPPTT